MERLVKGVPRPNLDKINQDMKDWEQIQGITKLVVSEQCSTISYNTNQEFSSEMCTFAPVLYSISPKPRETDRPAKPVPWPRAKGYKLQKTVRLYNATPRKCRQIEIEFCNLQKSSHLHPIAFEFNIWYKMLQECNRYKPISAKP